MRVLAVILIVAWLVGCANKEYVYVSVPELPWDEWIMDCLIQPPPDRAKFRAMIPERKLEAMANAYTGQVRHITSCNERLKTLREWKAEKLREASKKATQ